MDLTGVFIQVTNNNQKAYVYIMYQRAFDEMIANKDELNTRLRQTWSGATINVSYHDIGHVIEKLLRDVPVSEMLFSATETHVIVKSKVDPLIYERVHENPFGVAIKQIHHKLHDTFEQHNMITKLQNANPSEFAQTFWKQ